MTTAVEQSVDQVNAAFRAHPIVPTDDDVVWVRKHETARLALGGADWKKIMDNPKERLLVLIRSVRDAIKNKVDIDIIDYIWSSDPDLDTLDVFEAFDDDDKDLSNVFYELESYIQASVVHASKTPHTTKVIAAIENLFGEKDKKNPTN